MAKKTASNGSNIKVNTAKVRNVADELASLNRGIENDFDNICTAVANMDSSWDGAASNNAVSKFNKLKSECKSSTGRKAVMQQHIKFLKVNVAGDYENTENANRDLSSLFR